MLFYTRMSLLCCYLVCENTIKMSPVKISPRMLPQIPNYAECGVFGNVLIMASSVYLWDHLLFPKLPNVELGEGTSSSAAPWGCVREGSPFP